ncbi:MAG: peptidase prolyl oligopeptidase active site domain protein [Verrucomicrobia bacterium]|nr:peptidase prolyl oligopeptidase active site domain protein [Verrucomicrobiota bacterium]
MTLAKFLCQIGLIGTIIFTGISHSANGAAVATNSSPPSLEDFFVEPDYRSLQLSPDGRFLAFLTTLWTGRVGIAFTDLQTGKTEPLFAAEDENIQQFFWKGNDYILFGGDVSGNENYAWRSINLSKRKIVPLSDSFRERVADMVNRGDIVDHLESEPYFVLMSGNRTNGSYSDRLWKVDVRNAKREAVDTGDDKSENVDTVFTSKGDLVGRSRYFGDKILYEIRASNGDFFFKFAESPANTPQWEYRTVAANNETLYLISRTNSNTGTLHSINLRTHVLSAPLFNTPDGEIETVILSRDRTKLYGVSYRTDRDYYHWFDPARATLQAQIDRSLPKGENIVVTRSMDEKLMVVASVSDVNPGVYYLLDLRGPRLSRVGQINHRLNPEQLRPMEPIEYRARDGLTIHGYLTRPNGASNQRVPLIINPHGGPFGIRDSWGFNPEVQFLASRGYAVLQINYRGSGGYGYSFQKAGQREWGGKMQDDLTDGVKWAVDQGIADSERVAIYGASYGGYAALAGVTFTPELYRCAVNYVGASDLGILQRWGISGGQGSESFLAEWVGNDRTYIHDRSPVNYVDRIRVPTLHAYGYNDPRVDFDHWKRLEAKLKQYNKPYEILIEGNEGHGFHKESNRIEFYRRVEAFLDKNLKPLSSGRVEIGDAKIVEPQRH